MVKQSVFVYVWIVSMVSRQYLGKKIFSPSKFFQYVNHLTQNVIGFNN